MSNPTVCFVVPAHGRYDIARACLRQLARTCENLASSSIDATAVVVADDDNFDTARELGFGTVRRENEPLGRKWNDGFELAAKAGADYVVPFGSDDWIDPALIAARLEAGGDVQCSRRSAVVDEDGKRLARLTINYGPGLDFGDGVRTIRTSLLRGCNYRPAQEDARRAIDTSVWLEIRQANPRVTFTELHPLQIVDFKSRGEQLNPYDGFQHDRRIQIEESHTPWEELATIYPEEAIREMREVYA